MTNTLLHKTVPPFFAFFFGIWAFGEPVQGSVCPEPRQGLAKGAVREPPPRFGGNEFWKQ